MVMKTDRFAPAASFGAFHHQYSSPVFITTSHHHYLCEMAPVY
jgi:hypothetical protein